MEKRWKCSIFFLLFVFLCVITEKAIGDINTEIIAGTAMTKIVSLFEPEGSNNLIGTLEIVRKSSGYFYLRVCDINGAEIKKSGDLSNVGDVCPVYNSSGFIEKYKVFNTKSYSSNDMRLRVYNLDTNFSSTGTVNIWPTNQTDYYYANSIVPFSDGSYMAIGYNSSGVYMNKFNADDTSAWTQMKTLDISGGLNIISPSIADVSVTKGAGDSVIIGMTCGDKSGGGNVLYNLGIFNVNSDGVNNCPPAIFDQGGMQDMLGDLEADNNNIYVLASARGQVNVAYYLELDQSALQQENMYVFSDPKLVPYDASLDPDGRLYFAGMYGVYNGTGNADGLFGWMDTINPSNFEFFTKDFGGIIDGSFKTAAWNPTGAIFGGSSNDGSAWRGVYVADNTPPAVPEPATLLLMGFGLIGLAGVSRKKTKI